MAKQLNVNLAFKADTTQAKQQLQQLQNQLNNLTVGTVVQQLPITPKLQEAQNAAINLKIALQQSMNVDTGKFDLTKFNNSLKRAGTSLNQMRIDLSKFGPEGQQAFMTLAQSIMQAEVPMRRTNALLTQLGTTLKNTAKWQISSMALHGFMSAVSGAYGYAQDLNESLNNIRIVTGKNIDDMKKFADQANKAAKALSTTTTAYTDASLIYYQQGLSDAEVLKRADVTVKMANATGQAAEVVSDQMTAIWNNFYDGSKALEYYSDVVTALGAATASSSDEIAEGLEKFAAVADTVGLSYEYATSALATVTATTRQSADVVGTAFKTLFARIQDLELGKTLDDGTTLGAYAESLQAVGINIKESNGELKKMDDILSEMGSIWKTLGNDQQAALAQSVAGVRQYTQLMALMENWDYFKDNLEVAKDATGTLQEQADIYAESWEAAQKRVQASAQAIYQDLISDEFFIDLQNNFAVFLDIIDKAIDGMGGLKGVVALLGGVFLTTFSGQVARGLENMAYNIKMMTAWGHQEIMQTKELAYQEAVRISNCGYITEAQEMQAEVMQGQLKLQRNLVAISESLSMEDKQRCQEIIEQNRLYGEQAVQLKKNKDSLSDQLDLEKNNVKTSIMNRNGTNLTDEAKAGFATASQISKLSAEAQLEINKFTNLDSTKINTKQIDELKNKLSSLLNQMKQVGQEGDAYFTVETLSKALEDGAVDAEHFKQIMHELAVDNQIAINGMVDAADTLEIHTGATREQSEGLANTMYRVAEADYHATQSQKTFETSLKKSEEAIKAAKAQLGTWADSLVGIAGGISSIAFAIQSLSSIGNVFNNEDMSAGEKFLQITMSLSMALPMLINGLKSLRLVKLKDLTTTTLSTVAKIANAAATKAQAKAENQHATATEGSTKKTVKNTIAETANTVVKKIKGVPNGVKGSWKNLKENWNQQSLENNPNFTLNSETGKYAYTTKKGNNIELSKGVAEKVAGKQAISSVGKMASRLGLAAAAIAVVAGTITWASAQWNKAANEAKKTAEEASKLSNEFSNAQNQYSELKDTISNYQEGVKGLQELTKGTTEYTEAMMAANEEASKLIDQYGLTNYTIEDGLIKISEAELNAAKAAQLSQVSAKQRAAADANIKAKEAENEANRVKFNRNVNADAVTGWDVANTGATTVAGTIGGALMGGAIAGSAGGPVGAIVGAIVGLAAGITTAAVTGNEQKKEQEAIDGLAELYKNDKNIFATNESLRQALKEDLNIQDEDLIEELVKNRESTKELISSIDENNKLIQAQRATAMASYLQGDKTYQNSEYQDQITNILSKENENSAYTKALKEAEDKAWKGRDKNIHKAYAEYMGYEFVKDTHSGTGKFKDAQGNEIELDDKTIVEFLTNEYARQEAAKNVEEVSNLLDSLTNVSGLNDDDMATVQSAIADFIAGDSDKLLALSDEQMDAVKEQLKNGISLTDEEAQMLGYDNAKAFTEAFDKQFENWSSMSAEQRAEKMAAIKQQEFDSAIASTAQSLGVSSGALEGYTKALQNANPELKDNSEAAIAAAKANIDFSKGLTKLDEVLNDNLDILQNWNETSFETYEAASKVQAAVKDMFGVDVSANFVRDHLEDLQELTKGNTESLDELREAAAKDFVVNLGLEEGATNALDSALDALINQDREGIKIGAEVDLGSSVDQLNQFLKDGTLTAEQVTQAFNAIGYEPEIGYITEPGAQETHTSSRIEWNGLPLGTVDNYTTSDVSIPYIKSSTNKDSKGNSNKSSATKTTSTGSIAANLSGLKEKSDKKDATNLKSLNDEVDRYHEIEEVIDDLSKEMDKLAKAKDRAFGKDKIKHMQQELDVLDSEIAAQEKLFAQAEAYKNLDQERLTKFNSKVNIDPTTGNITNYTEIQADYLQRLANMDQESEPYKNLEEEYQTFKDYAAKYEETYDKYEEARVAANDKANEKIEKQLEMIDYSVEVNVEVNDRAIKNLERLLNRLDDDAFDGAERVANMTDQMAEKFEDIETYTKGIQQTLKTAGASDEAITAYMNGDTSAIANLDLTDAQIQQLKNYTDGIMDNEEAILELRESIESQVMTTFDAWHEKIEENSQAFEHATSIAESYKNIIDIVGKDTLGLDNAILKDLEDTQLAAAEGAMLNAKSQMETTQSALNDAKAKLANATTEEDKKFWQNTVNTLEVQLQEDSEAFMDSWETRLQTAADIFQAQMDRAFENLEDNLAGSFKSFDEMEAAMGQAETVSDRFLDNGKKQYELSKLNRRLNQDLAKTTSVKGQEELLAIQREIEELQASGAEMSKYDLEALQKKYDLKLAEIALEDAQNAKKQVRLRQDSEGNFGYVYTADQAAVADAAQNYEDKLEENRQLAIEQNKELSDAIVNNRKAMVEALQGIRKEDYEDAEAYQAALEETTRFYQEQEAYLIGETQKTIGRSKEIYDNDYLAYDGWSGNKELRTTIMYSNLENTQTTSYRTMGENTSGWVDSETQLMEQLGINIYDGVTTGEDGTKGSKALQEALGNKDTEGTFFGDTKKASEDWEVGIEEIMRQAGIDISNIKFKADEGLGQNGASKSFIDFETAVKNALYGNGGTKDKPTGGANAAIDTAIDRIADLAKTASDKFNIITDKVNTWQTDYSNKIGKAKTSTDNLNKSLDILLSKKAPNIMVTVKDTPAKTQLQSLIDQLKEINSKDITITTNYKTNGQITGGGSPTGNVSLGKITADSSILSNNRIYNATGTASSKKVANSYFGTGTQITGVSYKGTINAGTTLANGQARTDYGEEYYEVNLDNGNTVYMSKSQLEQWTDYFGKKFKVINTGQSSFGPIVQLDNGKWYLTNLFRRSIGKGDTVSGGIIENAGNGITKDYMADTGWGASKDSSVLTIGNSNSIEYGGVKFVKSPASEYWYKQEDLKPKYSPGNASMFLGYYIPKGAKAYQKFNTGGYTGEWGPEGRFAMLHQKEIVLNAHDTENMLATVQIVRSIADQLELNARTAQQGLSGYLAAANIKSVGDTIEQNVHITAEFPNATNHSEIEEAFRNLTNLASQYAYRN